MNKKGIGLLVTMVLFSVPAIYILGQQATAPTGGPLRVLEPQALQDMQKQIQKLEQQLSFLQKKVDALETNLNGRSTVVQQPLLTRGQELPAGSKPHTYNGITYYFVPLGSKGALDENPGPKPGFRVTDSTQ